MMLSKLLCITLLCSISCASISAQTIEKTDSVSKSAVTDSVAEPDILLEDFVISTTKKLVESDGATLTYNVSEDPEATTNSTLEILRKVPGVTVDANEDIRVNGQSSFKIYLNGREDPMLKGDIKTILKSMPAATIKKIEVISEPGAKYEAEGTGGILNIVTITKQSLSGYLTNLNLWIRPTSIGGSAYGRTKIKNVTASLHGSYNNGRIFHRYNYNHSEIENYESEENRLQVSDQRSRNEWDYWETNLDLSWEPDTLNLFTAGINFSNNTWGGSPVEQTMTMYNSNMDPTWSLKRDFISKGTWLGTSAQLSYQHNFRNPDHHLITSYSFDYSDNDNNSDIYMYELVGHPIMDDEAPYSRNMREAYGLGHIFQIDYSNKFSSKHHLEAGAKGSFNTNNANSAPWYGNSADNLVMDDSQHVKVNQFRDIIALYSSYSGSFGKWSFRAGLRYEYTHMGLKYKIGDYSSFTTILNDLVPNLSSTFKFTDSSNLRLAYQMRIARPGLGVLNPYRNTLTPNQVSYGNPNLVSEKSHNISLAYSNYGGKVSGSFKVKYYFSNNQVSDMIFIQDGIMNTTYANIGKYNNVAFETSLNWDIIKDMSFSLWLQETYEHMSADSPLLKGKRINWRTYVNGNYNYRFPNKIRFSAYGGGGSPWADLQSKGSPWYYYGIGLSRSFLKEDALTLSLNAQNFAPARRKSSWSQVSESVRTYSQSSYPQWSVGFSISYKFGGLKADVKRTAAVIEQEATTSGSNKGS